MFHIINTSPTKQFLLFIFGILLCHISQGVTYYVDSEFGNDQNNGQSRLKVEGNVGPWKSLEQVNTTIFQPGDSILFRRGREWSGTILTTGAGIQGAIRIIEETVNGKAVSISIPDSINPNYIYYGAYGTGSQPKINCNGQQGFRISHNYIIVDNLHFVDGGNNMIDFNRMDGNFWTTIRNLTLNNCRGNVVRFSQGGGNCWIYGLNINDYQTNGIYLEGSPNNPLKEVLVEKNIFSSVLPNTLEDAISCHKDRNQFDITGLIIIRNNLIYASGEDGIDVTSGKNILIESNYIENCLEGGINIGNSSVSDIEVRGNFLKNNSQNRTIGDVTIGVNNVRIINNIITGNGHHALLLNDCSNIHIWNNTISPNDRTGFFIWFRNEVSSTEFVNNIFDFSKTNNSILNLMNNDSIRFHSNLFYARTLERQIVENLDFPMLNDLYLSDGNIFADPLFVQRSGTNPACFRISINSPCINKGTDVDLNYDFRGENRGIDDGIDIGAFEYTTSLDTNLILEPEYESTRNQIEIFPNPVNNLLNINLTSIYEGSIELRIFNLNGILVDKVSLNKIGFFYSFRHNISSLTAGWYFISVPQLDNMTIKFIHR